MANTFNSSTILGQIASLVAEVGPSAQKAASVKAAKGESEPDSKGSHPSASMDDGNITPTSGEHAAELEAAKIQAGQAAVMEVLETSAPEALPHVETVEGAAETHTAKYNALRAQGKYAEAGEYRKAHLNEIFKGE